VEATSFLDQTRPGPFRLKDEPRNESHQRTLIRLTVKPDFIPCSRESHDEGVAAFCPKFLRTVPGRPGRLPSRAASLYGSSHTNINQ